MQLADLLLDLLLVGAVLLPLELVDLLRDLHGLDEDLPLLPPVRLDRRLVLLLGGRAVLLVVARALHEEGLLEEASLVGPLPQLHLCLTLGLVGHPLLALVVVGGVVNGNDVVLGEVHRLLPLLHLPRLLLHGPSLSQGVELGGRGRFGARHLPRLQSRGVSLGDGVGAPPHLLGRLLLLIVVHDLVPLHLLGLGELGLPLDLLLLEGLPQQRHHALLLLLGLLIVALRPLLLEGPVSFARPEVDLESVGEKCPLTMRALDQLKIFDEIFFGGRGGGRLPLRQHAASNDLFDDLAGVGGELLPIAGLLLGGTRGGVPEVLAGGLVVVDGVAQLLQILVGEDVGLVQEL
uniref:Uncharacterized protein n=1 Tax=Strombidium rassoulzadegani TaxID=1082188 RepID=A0A7S3FX01_9SPIT|mmetsp:Transcript_2602/g.4357  ORF Transcript_2602/g.4357 Transcript_2602/m.4357 type:complete len:348 (+) Transcript_2602:1537-2580(+)